MMNILETRQKVGTDITWYNCCHGYEAKKNNNSRSTDDGQDKEWVADTFSDFSSEYQVKHRVINR